MRCGSRRGDKPLLDFVQQAGEAYGVEVDSGCLGGRLCTIGLAGGQGVGRLTFGDVPVLPGPRLPWGTVAKRATVSLIQKPVAFAVDMQLTQQLADWSAQVESYLATDWDLQDSGRGCRVELKFGPLVTPPGCSGVWANSCLSAWGPMHDWLEAIATHRKRATMAIQLVGHVFQNVLRALGRVLQLWQPLEGQHCTGAHELSDALSSVLTCSDIVRKSCAWRVQLEESCVEEPCE